MKLARYLLPLAALAMTTGYGFAQTATPAPPTTKPAVTAPAPAQADTGKKTTLSAADKAAKSKECSAQADQKGLHGKARKRFRDDCKRH
ncbi:PsiF family protein [Bosea thiooxidans]|nr:PsiF family protein [Bosea sp. (in: a-proteobacteria)]